MVRGIRRELLVNLEKISCGRGNKLAKCCSKMQSKACCGVITERPISAQYDNSMVDVMMLSKNKVFPLYFLVLLNLDSACVLFGPMKREQKGWVWLSGWDNQCPWFSSPLFCFKTLNTVAHVPIKSTTTRSSYGSAPLLSDSSPAFPQYLKPFHRLLSSSSLVVNTNSCPPPYFLNISLILT